MVEGRNAGGEREMADALKTKYGVSMDDFDGVVSHKAWRMMNDLAKLTATQAKAPRSRNRFRKKPRRSPMARCQRGRRMDNSSIPRAPSFGTNALRTQPQGFFMKSGSAKSLLREG